VAPLTQIIMLTFGPRAVIGEEFANLATDQVVIFGSWAARLSGEPGPMPADVDVLVIGDPVDRDAVYAAASQVARIPAVLHTLGSVRHGPHAPAHHRVAAR